MISSQPQFQEVASGLMFPEGPVALPNGDILVVEIATGNLIRIREGGRKEVLANVGGGPNGAAIGPDGKCYICNNGGLDFTGHVRPGLQPASYTGGSIQRVELETGLVETIYTHCGGRALRGPNDLVFDAEGGFWFTDYGKERDREIDVTGVFYAKADGTEIKEAIFPLKQPNGIGISPDGNTLYVTETYTARLWAFEIVAPGVVNAPRTGHGVLNPFSHAGRLLAIAPVLSIYDSLAIDAAGNICIGTLLNGGITIVTPEGVMSHLSLPDVAVTNICFGGDERKTAFITLSATGRVIAVEWPRPGLCLAF